MIKLLSNSEGYIQINNHYLHLSSFFFADYHRMKEAAKQRVKVVANLCLTYEIICCRLCVGFILRGSYEEGTE